MFHGTMPLGTRDDKEETPFTNIVIRQLNTKVV